ncbi:hypothetical protein [Metabacillus iocasae]|uniref:Flagellar hook-length control protein-like C-terminal domain-containing protein n=1 Tax=Priestia iocasae TaxID=2291674 RepID=A0ABS2QQW6_9BACI|nr:hypothetical protein [Metabacillus iocasae]MBM7701848.1 hypothetical protein [Metabacillus iocasae]
MIVSSFQHFFQEEVMKQSKNVHLTKGDFVQGKIVKLFSNHTALVHINDMSLVAKLETALSVQQQYWFEVKGTTLSGPHLKVLSHVGPSPNGNELDKQQVELLRELQLPATRGNKELVSFLTEKGLPLSKQKVVDLSNLFIDKKLSAQDKQVVEKLIEMKLPITNETFQAVSAIQKGSHLSADLVKLQQLLVQNNVQEAIPLQKMIATLTQPFSVREGEDRLASLVKTWLSTTHTNNQQENQAFSMMRQSHVIPKEMSEQRALAHLMRYFNIEGSSNNQNLYDVLFSQKNAIQGQGGYSLSAALKEMVASFYVKDGAIEEIDIESKLEQLGKTIFTNEQQSLLLTQSEKRSAHSMFYKAIMQVIESLGLQHEVNVVASLKDHQEHTQSLKSLLLQAQQTLPPSPTLEVVEQLVHKLTGIQLLNQDQGPLTTIYMQMPLHIGQGLKDVTIQWNGRKKENGQIDSNYCHILFYLCLDEMKETVIDVTVQNRIVTVHIINEAVDKVSPLAEAMKATLQSGLNELQYKLSEVKVLGTMKKQVKHHQSAIKTSHSYEGGLDIRI